jgi:hypothetical protein
MMARPREFHPLHGERPGLAEVRGWIGWAVDDVHGSTIGRLEDVIADARGGAAAWLVVHEFRFGDGRRFQVPADEALGNGGRVWVPYERELVRRSAELGSPRRSREAGRRLREHYARGSSAA